MASLATQSSIGNTSRIVTLPDIPELSDPNYLDILLPEQKANETPIKTKDDGPQNPLITALVNDNRTYTENGAFALSSTGSATLDAFSGLSGGAFGDVVDDHLTKAWAEDPGLTLRLIWNIRSIHDGKGEKELFYRAFGWLYDNHPRTAISNLHWLITPACTTRKGKDTARPHGYWKDLLNILALETCDQLSGIAAPATFLHNPDPRPRGRLWWTKRPRKFYKPGELKELRELARQKRKELHGQFHERLTAKLTNDPKYRALYITITRLFAEQLRKDMGVLQELEGVDKGADRDRYYQLLKSITLAGKWAPTPGGSHDRVTNISTAICQLLFSPTENVGKNPIGPLPRSAPIPISTDRENCITLRSFYGRWILRPLRETLCCPEPLMSAKRWTEIQYTRVPSLCMANNKTRFIEHDPEGFQLYLIDVQSGKRKISGATLMPHELLGEAMRLKNDMNRGAWRDQQFPKLAEAKARIAEQEMKVVDAQWRTLVSRLKESGTLDNSLAICDVSGSMGSIECYDKRSVSPIFPSVALSLMLASLAKPPFDAGFITFSENPEFVRLENLEEAGLCALANKVAGAYWGMNTNFQAVFLKLLLPLAKQHNIAREDMVKRLFVFSDMQFDAAASGHSFIPWETSHDLVERAYKEAGYDVPEIVYWNLVGGYPRMQTFEVEAERKGVAMMSGFSAAMMKVFMGEGEEVEDDDEWAEAMEDGEVVANKENEFTPLNVMKKALFKKSFDGLVVVD